MGTISLNAQQKFETKSLSIFKNGQSFVVKEGVVDVTDMQYKMTDLPQALFGTFWFTNEAKSIVAVTGKYENSIEKRERKVIDLTELFRVNKGKSVTITTFDNKVLSGVLDGDNSILMLKTDTKWIALKSEHIQSMEFSENPDQTITDETSLQKPTVTIHFKKNGSQSVNMMYLQNGLNWVPVYKLELLSETSARLTLQAEVTNAVEDIEKADIDFVVGVPKFSSANAPATLLSLIQAIPSSSYVTNAYSNSQIFSARANKELMYDESYATADYSNYEVKTSENEDLYFYTAKGVTLSKGSTGNFPLMDKEVKIKHFYSCNLPASTFQNYRVSNIQEDYYYEDNNDTDRTSIEKHSDVHHYIRITNDTEFPLTSGPTLIVQKDTKKALAQNTLYFTPKGSSTPLLVTNSPDVEVKEYEEITETKLNVKTINGYDYALVTIKGKISINNTKSKGVEMEINRVVPGQVLSTSEKHKSSIVKTNDNINKSQNLSFNPKVKANSSHVIEYVYQIYSRQYN